MDISREQILLILCCFAIVLIAGCTSNNLGTTSAPMNNTTAEPPKINESEKTWMSIPITDVVTGRQTSIIDLASQGKPIIIHTFAVWCPACSMQLRETKRLSQNNPDTFIILGVDLDPRENSVQVKNHIEKNNFDGMFVSAPPEFTRSLMRTVGDQIVQSLPQTIIISNRTVTYIGDGVFSENKLGSILSQLPS